MVWVFLPAYGAEKSVVSLTLEQSIGMALRENEAIKLARTDVKKSRAQVKEAWASVLPKIDVSVNHTANWLLPSTVFDTPTGRQTVTIGTRYNTTGSVTFRQPVYSGGKTRAALQVAKSFMAVAEAGSLLVHQQVKVLVETAFCDLLLAQELVAVSEQALLQAKANLAQTESLHRVGRVSNYEVLRAKVQVAEQRPDSLRARNNLELAANVFKNVVGLDQNVTVQLDGSFRTESALDTLWLNDLMREGTRQRPEIQRLQAQIHVQAQNIKIEKAASRPTIDLTANGQLQAQSNSFGFNKDDAQKSWTTGIALSVPIFDGLRTRSRVTQATLDLQRAEIERKQLERDISLQIRQAWSDLEEVRKRVDAQEIVVAHAEQGVSIVTSRYANGMSTQLEVLDGQLVLTRARIAAVQALRDRAVALVRLEQVAGYCDERHFDWRE